MNSTTDETSITISTEVTPLLQTDPPIQPPRIKNLRTKIFFLLRILLVLIACFFILYSIHSKNPKKQPEPLTPYFSGLARFYCHLTPHPKLCHHSMSSVTNATFLESDPALIFALPLQLVATELSHANISITRALSNSTFVLGARLSVCQASIGDSLSRIGRSLGYLRVDFFDEWLETLVPYVDEQNIYNEMRVVENNSGGCLLALGDDAGVEEVKLGVEKATRLIANFIAVFEGRDRILDDFYNRYNTFYYADLNFDGVLVHGFDYVFTVCLFSVMYMFLALLYFLFWQ